MKKLPTFKGYTVDVRLKQFRRIEGEKIIFIDFDSIEGEKILTKYVECLNKNSIEFKELINNF